MVTLAGWRGSLPVNVITPRLGGTRCAAELTHQRHRRGGTHGVSLWKHSWQHEVGRRKARAS